MVMVMAAVSVVVITVAVIEARILGRTHHPVGFEQAHAQKQGERHFALDRTQNAGIFFDFAQLVLQGHKSALLNEIGLVEHQDVAIDHLGSTHLAGQNLGAEILGINQGDDRVEPCLVAQLAAQKGHRHWQRIGQAGGFHHEILRRAGAIEDAINGVQQFAVDRTADAAVAQFDHVFTSAHHQLVVDSDLSELIHQNGGFQPVLIAQNVIEQCGFASP